MEYIDHLNRKINLNTELFRIVSLCPSQTELLFYLGLSNQIVGRTKFCVHPKPAIKAVPIVGGTKNPNIQKIIELKPDLIIAEKEENRHEDILALEAAQIPTYVTNVESYEDALKMITDIGKITHKEMEALKLVNEIREKFASIQLKQNKIKVAYLIWHNPTMLAGRNTYINSMLNILGLENIAHFEEKRYPEISLEKLKDLSPEVIFLSSEPYPFKQKHLEYYSSLFPSSKVMLVDGEMFSWYGNRMLLLPDYWNGFLANF